ncbi:Cullin repeat-like-containing domain protein, partial [Syncephalis pseudoplumigaleata]
MSSHGGGGSAPGRDPETGRASAANQRRLPSTGGSVAVARSGQARKLIVKNFKDKPKLPDNFERDSWRKLQAAIVAIYEQTKVTESLEELYRLADKLYGYLLAESERHVTTIAQRLSTYQGDSASFLEQIHQEWVNYCRHIKIRSVFLYLDRTYVLRTPSVAPICHILNQQSIGPLVLTGLLKLIEQERQGETIDRPLVKTLVDMYRDLSLYTSHFEAPFLHASAVFYEAEGKRLLDSLSTSAYLVHCEQRLHEEQERLQLYLDEEKTRDKLVQVVEKGLISCNMQHLLDTGFSDLIANERVDDLSRLYSLCKRVDMLDALRAALAKHIKAQGMAIVSDADHDDQMVTRLLALKQQIDTVHSKAFEHAQAFGHTIIESFESFINSRANKPAEMI